MRATTCGYENIGKGLHVSKRARSNSGCCMYSYSKPKHSNQLNIAQSMLGESKFKSIINSFLNQCLWIFKILMVRGGNWFVALHCKTIHYFVKR